MIVIMRDDYRIIYFSPFAERLTGYSTDDVTQKSFLDIFSVDTTSVATDGWFNCHSLLPAKNIDLPIRCRDGSLRWLSWNALRLEDFDGQSAVLAVGHDITDKRDSAERLLQAERLAAIGQTITGLAHESRNALQRINSCMEMLELEVEDNREAMQLIRRSQKAQDDLARLFDEMRNFAAPIALELARCPIANTWREAWGLVQPDCRGRDVELDEHVELPDLTMRVDRFRMVQVFRNLFENSLAACRDPVRIQIVCRQMPRDLAAPDASAHHRALSSTAAPQPYEVASEWVEIRIRDNGPGLDAKARREVFEPFFTTKAKGTGLGMPIAKRIIEAHGGVITVGDCSQRGAEFVLMLPRCSDEPMAQDCGG
jgi:PAS domain S-box-containing protein